MKITRDHMILHNRGFTLIELLVVLALISVGLLIAVNGIKNGIAVSNDSAAKQDAEQLDQLMNQYYAEHGSYPTIQCNNTSFDGSASVSSLIPSGDQYYQSFSNLVNGGSMASLISKGTIGYCASPVDSNGNSTAYIIIVQTQTTQNCADTAGNNYYILGRGSYSNAIGYRNYYNIPTDESMPRVANASNYGITCFKI